jgi:putative SOS response-associated peptidase YedK
MAVYRPADDLSEFFGAAIGPGLVESYRPSWNVAPTAVVVGLVGVGDGERLLLPFRWGFGPDGRRFNARAETLATSRTFAPGLAARRLAVLADGFFEWQERRPLFFHRADGRPLALAGIWQPGAGGSGMAACALVTTAAGADLADVHDRMPVVLEAEALGPWLAPDRGPAADIPAPAPAGTLARHPVDPRVGDVRNDDPSLVRPWEPQVEALRLFP